MHNNSIRSLLNIPEYKIKEIISKTDTYISIRIEPYKRNKGICSGCGEKHRSYHSIREMNVKILIRPKNTFMNGLNKHFPVD